MRRTVGSPRFADVGSPWFWPYAQRRGGELVLTLPRVPRSDEGLNGRTWKRRHAAHAEWCRLVELALCTLARTRHPRWARVTIHYTVHRTAQREMDRENAVGCLKGIPDALTRAHVIPDDSPEHVVATPTVEQLRSPLQWGWTMVQVRRAGSTV